LQGQFGARGFDIVGVANDNYSLSGAIHIVDRVALNICVKVQVVLTAQGVGLEEPVPLTPLIVLATIFPRCLRGLRRIFAVAIHALAKNRLEAVFLQFSKTVSGNMAQARARGKVCFSWLRGRPKELNRQPPTLIALSIYRLRKFRG
jgi:hypothetical protein